MTGPWLLPTARFGLVALATLMSAIALAWGPGGAWLGRLMSGPGGLLGRLPVPGLETFAPAQAALAVALFTLSAASLLARLVAPARRAAVLTTSLFLFHLPGLLSYSALDWGRFLLKRPVVFSSAVPPVVATSLALATAAALFAAFLIARWQSDLGRLDQLGTDPRDRATYTRSHLAVGGWVIGGATVATAAVLLLAMGLSAGPRQAMGLVPWPMVVLGFGAASMILVAAFLIRVRWLDRRPALGETEK